MRKTLLPVLALALVTVLACGFGDQTSPGGGGTSDQGTSSFTPDPDGDDTPAATPAARASTTDPTGSEPLTCEQLRTAELGNAEQPYQGRRSPIRLTDGSWSGDGMVVQLQWPCAIGDLTGDDVDDAVVPVLMDGGGTGKFWQIAFFGNIDARPHYVTTTEIGDRTPVETVSISDRKVTVVFLMRPEDPSSTADVVRRTATYELNGSRLVKTAHTDSPA
ncbi:hypothetical protein ACIBJE_15350 [Micromonospora sp. NPDC050187]|uniref:hypothetical protein n=1 Tax=Micromonospora sp. NPDC050187 TaxID=3364277 RepID=UPI0037AD14C5